MSLSLTIRAAIGAGATNPNILSGTDIEFLGAPAVLTILGNGDIAGMSASLRYTVNGTPVNPIPTSTINAASTVGNVKADEDLLIADLALPAGARLVMPLTNPGAASLFTMRFLLR